MNRVAVYGSLKQGAYNHRWLGEAAFGGRSTVNGYMFLLGGCYPGLVEATDKAKDKYGEPKQFPVEIYEVSDERYRAIKQMEEGAGYYAKDQAFPVENGGVIDATVYYIYLTYVGRNRIHGYTKETVPSAFQ